MRKLLLAALGVAVVMAFGAGTAAANRSIESSETRIRATFRELTFSGGGLSITCPVTLELTLHSRSIAKVERTLIGSTSIRVGEAACRGGTARALPGTYNVRFISFTGTLPEIRSIRLRLERTAFLLSVGAFGECLYLGDADGIVGVERRTITELRADESSTIPLSRTLSGFCPGSGRFRGRAEVSPRATLRLL